MKQGFIVGYRRIVGYNKKGGAAENGTALLTHQGPRRVREVLTYKRTNIVDRFWSKVDIRREDECWTWLSGGLGATGYGCFTVSSGQLGFANHTRVPAHRVSWMLSNYPFKDSKVCVLHKCDNRKCVNPSHLLLGTRADNAHDRHAKGRSRNGTTKLTQAQVDEIRRLYVPHVFGQIRLGKMFGVNHAQIRRIVKNKQWVKPTGLNSIGPAHFNFIPAGISGTSLGYNACIRLLPSIQDRFVVERKLA